MIVVDSTITTYRPDTLSQVVIGYTDRNHGVSVGAYARNNLAYNVGDDLFRVTKNRTRLEVELGGSQICWLKQVHSNTVVRASPTRTVEADAMWTSDVGLALGILTADCLPVLIYSGDGMTVAAAHCGWRGLASGILESLMGEIGDMSDSFAVWIGPAICGTCYEVQYDVLNALEISPDSCALEESPREGRYFLNLANVVKHRLQRLGVSDVTHSGICSYTDTNFYSYRRDGTTGRFVSLICKKGNQ